MGVRFRKSISLGKNTKINMGKGNFGISSGVKGARMSINSSGRMTRTLGVPGTGISHVSSSNVFDEDISDNVSSIDDSSFTAEPSKRIPSKFERKITKVLLILLIVLSCVVVFGFVCSVIDSQASAPAPTLIKVTSSVTYHQGEDAFLSIKAKPYTKYKIRVVYNSGASKAKGLITKKSDKNGKVSWTWKIGTKTKEGTYVATVSGGDATKKIKFKVIS